MTVNEVWGTFFYGFFCDPNDFPLIPKLFVIALAQYLNPQKSKSNFYQYLQPF